VRKILSAAVFILALPGVLSAATREDLVVTTAWLAEHLNDPRLVLLQVGQRQSYDAGHIPGARYVDVMDFAPEADGLAMQMPSAEGLHERLVALGISSDSRVVVYFTRNGVPTATRLILTLDYAGLDDVRLLDGGFAAWQNEERPITRDVPVLKPGNLPPLKRRPVIASAERIQAASMGEGVVVIDARAPVFYDGTQQGSDDPPKRGHIPGARSVPYSSPYTPAGTLKPADELKKLFGDAGVKPGDTVIAYCHIGLQATATLFAARTLGHTVLLYDGSFEDWSRRGLPVEVPPGK
jgi:thiosulfate/3-mercaptopyruvate sulfurtransferase